MKKIHGKLLLALLTLSLLGGLCPAVVLAAPEGGGPGAAQPSDSEERDLIVAAQAMRKAGLVQFNFKDMELVKFIRFMSELLPENIIVPPNISAKITIISPRPSSLSEARQIMLSTLQMYGFSLQNMGPTPSFGRVGSAHRPGWGAARVGRGTERRR